MANTTTRPTKSSANRTRVSRANRTIIRNDADWKQALDLMGPVDDLEAIESIIEGAPQNDPDAQWARGYVDNQRFNRRGAFEEN